MPRGNKSTASPWLLKDRIKLYEQFPPAPSLDGFPVISGGDIPKAMSPRGYKTHNRMPAQHGTTPRRFSPRSTMSQPDTLSAFGRTQSSPRDLGGPKRPTRPHRTRAAKPHRKKNARGVTSHDTFDASFVGMTDSQGSMYDSSVGGGSPRTTQKYISQGSSGSGAKNLSRITVETNDGDASQDELNQTYPGPAPQSTDPPARGIGSVEVQSTPSADNVNRARTPSRTEVLSRPKSAAAVAVPQNRGAAGNIMIRRKSAASSRRRSSPRKRLTSASGEELDFEMPEQKFLIDTLGHVSQAGNDQRVTVQQYKDAIKENTEYLTKLFKQKLEEQRRLLGSTDFEVKRRYKQELLQLQKDHDTKVEEWSTKFKALKAEQGQWRKLGEDMKNVKRENEQLTRHFKSVIADMEATNAHLSQKVDELRVSDTDKVGLAKTLQEEMEALRSELRAKDTKIGQLRDAAKVAAAQSNEADETLLADMHGLRELLAEKDNLLAGKDQALYSLKSEIDALQRARDAAEIEAAAAIADAERKAKAAAAQSAKKATNTPEPSREASREPVGPSVVKSPSPSRQERVTEPVTTTTPPPQPARPLMSAGIEVELSSPSLPVVSSAPTTPARARKTSAGPSVSPKLRRASTSTGKTKSGKKSKRGEKAAAAERERLQQAMTDDLVKDFHDKIAALKTKAREDLEERNNEMKRQMYRVHEMIEAMKKAMEVTLDVDDSLHVDLTCQKCFKLMNEPVALQCGHSFCKTCIENTKLNEEFVFCNVCDNTQETLTIPNNVADDIVSRYGARQVSLQNVIEIMFQLTGVVEKVAGVEGDTLDRDKGDRINAEQDAIAEKLLSSVGPVGSNHTPATAQAVSEAHSRSASRTESRNDDADFRETPSRQSLRSQLSSKASRDDVLSLSRNSNTAGGIEPVPLPEVPVVEAAPEAAPVDAAPAEDDPDADNSL